MKDDPAALPARRRGAGRLTAWIALAAERLRTATVPFKIGDVVLGDDPFNGRQMGTVAVIRGSSLGLRSATDGHPDIVPNIVFYDYRQVKKPD
jgi:hypothetical protein